jgi:hypothetical protein
MLYNDLPVDILLYIISFLSIEEIQPLALLSRKWSNFISTHESVIYHNVAIYHGMVASGHDLKTSIKNDEWETNWLDDCNSWRDYAQRHIKLEKAWLGERLVSESQIDGAGKAVWRLKVDPVERTALTTSTRGGLNVVCVETNDLLWSLPRNYVRTWAHLEFSDGFAIFDREEMELEVWRRSTDTDILADGTPPAPHPTQLGFAAHPGRGVYFPYTILRLPEPCCAFRFVFPHLLVAGWDGKKAFIFDVPNATLIQTINITAPGLVKYVEISQNHIFVCRDVSLSVYSRRTGELTLRLPEDLPTDDTDERVLRCSLYTLGEVDSTTDVDEDQDGTFIRSQKFEPSSISFSARPFDFTAVHVSPEPCPAFVAGTVEGFLIIVKAGVLLECDRLKEQADRREALRKGSSALLIGSPILNLAFDGRRAIFSTRDGVSGVNLPVELCADARIPLSTATSAPISMFTVTTLSEPIHLAGVSCVQVTRTGIWLTWPAHSSDGFDAMVLHYVNFAPSKSVGSLYPVP